MTPGVAVTRVVVGVPMEEEDPGVVVENRLIRRSSLFSRTTANNAMGVRIS
jgi:hypothetical protein